MRKSIFVVIIAIAFLSLIGIRCTKTVTNTLPGTVDTTKITGTVSVPGGPAAGAIVILSSTPNAANVITRVVADASGKYVIPGVKAGTYYISCSYNTENTNLKSSAFTFTTASSLTVTVAGIDMVKDIALVSNAASGTDIIEYAVTGNWNFDATHSKIIYEFPYDSVNAKFSGMFTNYGINTFKFDQANPGNSVIDVWVDITSSETGAATVIDTVAKKAVGGRDGLNGCISHTFGVTPAVADTFFKGYYRPSSILSAGALILSAKASFVSSTVAAYGDGYVATGQLTFHGVSSAVSLYFHYIKGYSATASGKTTTYSSFSGFFDMAASKTFLITSGHVKKNLVHVTTDLQFNK